MKRATTIIIIFVLLSFVASAQAATKITSDITRITVGARILGMGKASAALSNDVNAVFSNPAGLATLDSWQLSSMSGKLLEEVNYISLSGAYPTEYGTFGFGYSNASIGGAYPTLLDTSVNPQGEVVVDLSKSVMNFSNNALLVAYGNQVYENLAVGANIKFFSAKLEGGSITDGNATGTQVDLGLIYNVNENIDIAAAWQNALPAGLGGSLTYTGSGQQEIYPSTLKIGGKFKSGNWTILADTNLYLNRKNSPSTLHIGGEYRVNTFAVLRAGIDQEIISSSVINNLTAGVGLEFKNIKFDYAYHQFAGAPGNDTHFFSLSYGLFEKPEIKETPKAELEAIEIYEPLDGAIFF